MAKLFGDENFDNRAMNALHQLGHDTLTSKAAGMANQRIPDQDVLKFATQNDRAVVTFNRKDFLQLHKSYPDHAGIIACTYNADAKSLADSIHEGIKRESEDLKNKFIRIYRDKS